jgi:hypothetical protein
VTGQLNVPLAAVLTDLGEGARTAEVVRGEAVVVTLLETFVDGGMTTELYRMRIRPGRLQTSPAHPAGVVEYVTVFAGVARVGPVDAPFLIPAGSHGRWMADTPHLYATATEEEVHATLVIRHPDAADAG